MLVYSAAHLNIFTSTGVVRSHLPRLAYPVPGGALGRSSEWQLIVRATQRANQGPPDDTDNGLQPNLK